MKLGLICQPIAIEQMLVERFNGYLGDGQPDFVVRIKWSEPKAKDRNSLATIDRIEGTFNQEVYKITSPYYEASIDPGDREAKLTLTTGNPQYDLDYFLRIVTSFGLYVKGGFLFHAAGVVYDNKAYLFFGKSGSGKTTVAKFSSGSTILSDDLVGIVPMPESVIAFSTPFWNPGWARYDKAQARVAGIYRLAKSQLVAIESIKESIATSEILSSIPVIPLSRELCANLIPMIQDVITKVGVYYLYFKKDNSFWKLIEPEIRTG